MSGGNFDYKQYQIGMLAEEIEQIIFEESLVDVSEYSDETLKEFVEGVKLLRQAYVYAQRIDYLVSADDGEDSFHKRLKYDLDKIL